MATNEKLDEVLYNQLEKIKSDDLNDQEELDSNALYEVIGDLLGLKVSPSVASTTTTGILRGFKIVAAFPASMTVSVMAGLGFYWDTTAGWVATGRSLIRPLMLVTTVDFILEPADPGLNRTDIVLVRPALYADDNEARDIKDPVTDTYSGQNVNKRNRVVLRSGTYVQFQAGTADICVKTGTPGGGVPATDAGSISVGEILVEAAVVSVDDTKITDRRKTAATRASIPYVAGILDEQAGFAFPGDWSERVKTGGGRVVSITRVSDGRYTFEVDGFGAYWPIVTVRTRAFPGLIIFPHVSVSILNDPADVTKFDILMGYWSFAGQDFIPWDMTIHVEIEADTLLGVGPL